jgi:malonyl-CoA O-methyltransferase
MIVHFLQRIRSRSLRAIRHGTPPKTLPSIDAYALWAQTYPPYAHNRLMEIEQQTMLHVINTSLQLAGRDVLDLACGTGRYGLIAAKMGARRVVGVDNSGAMLRAGALRPTAEAAMISLPFGGDTFDVVLCGLAMGHLPPDGMRRAVREINRILRTGGEALISDFHPMLYLQGGRRTFAAPDGTLYAVEHYPHLVSDYFAAISDSGMIVAGIEEPRATPNGSKDGNGISLPAVLVIRCRN